MVARVEKMRQAFDSPAGVRTPVELDRRPFVPPSFPDEAIPGPWGRFVRLWESSTSAHPGSIVCPALVLCGVHGGEGVRLGKQRTIAYVAMVGISSLGRKDTGLGIAIEFAELIGARAPTFGQPNSGEGIWYLMRDPDGKDAGAVDKRLCLIDTEMGGTFAAMHRPNSTVQAAMLALYDFGTKKPLTKNDRVSVTNGHFAYIGLTTPRQFVRNVTHDDRENGVIQRLNVAAVGEVRQIKPSQAMAPDIDEVQLRAIAEEIADRMLEAVSRGRVWRFGNAARDYLDDLAPGLVDGSRPETARAVAHVTRWAMIYCLTVPPEPGEQAQPGVVALSHMRAGAALWGYFDASARMVLGADDVLEKVLIFTSDANDGLSRTDLFRLVGGHVTADQLDDAIKRGVEQGKLRTVKLTTNKCGRPPIVVEAV